MVRIKRNHNHVIVSRTETEAKFKVSYKGEEQRKRVEGNIIEFFSIDDEAITIIDEVGNLKRVITP